MGWGPQSESVFKLISFYFYSKFKLKILLPLVEYNFNTIRLNVKKLNKICILKYKIKLFKKILKIATKYLKIIKIFYEPWCNFELKLFYLIEIFIHKLWDCKNVNSSNFYLK